MKINEKVFKVLSNQIRLDILKWLKNPLIEFESVPKENLQYMLDHFGGICGTVIVDKSGLAQSTISSYLKDLQQVGLISSERHGKWTYYKRNNNNIDAVGNFIQHEL
ncbi:transcriptional regulator [Fructobacillus tropaeoli]|uniref:ArsR/SmtB family transcription factor n=1 Tax=Fructobacillus tropaeoli TaxID=709323 RepID=UPI0014562529|nr:helix-turn-helix transcriptional regulator [Fructobacillus tropaeoli]NLS38453.1 transcriptional regulator [Fructobacillus tropaeoli]